jgi:hypothetical protein
MVCALLGLAVAVLCDVARAPGPSAPVLETPIVIVGLERFRQFANLPRPPRRPRATPTFFEELPDVVGEVEVPTPPAPPERPRLPSVIVDETVA